MLSDPSTIAAGITAFGVIAVAGVSSFTLYQISVVAPRKVERDHKALSDAAELVAKTAEDSRLKAEADRQVVANAAQLVAQTAKETAALLAENTRLASEAWSRMDGKLDTIGNNVDGNLSTAQNLLKQVSIYAQKLEDALTKLGAHPVITQRPQGMDKAPPE